MPQMGHVELKDNIQRVNGLLDKLAKGKFRQVYHHNSLEDSF